MVDEQRRLVGVDLGIASAHTRRTRGADVVVCRRPGVMRTHGRVW
jgi:hypothetical protein